MQPLKGYAATAPRKNPQQARAIVTRGAILEASARILESGTSRELNTNRIAEVAGVSPGTLYQYFGDTSAVVTALIDAEVAKSLRTLSDIEAGLDATARFAYALGGIVRSIQVRPVLSAKLMLTEPLYALNGRTTPEIDAQLQLFSDLMAAHLGLPHADAGLAKKTRSLAKGLLLEAATRGAVAEANLPEQVIEAVMAYLELHRPRRAGGPTPAE